MGLPPRTLWVETPYTSCEGRGFRTPRRYKPLQMRHYGEGWREGVNGSEKRIVRTRQRLLGKPTSRMCTLIHSVLSFQGTSNCTCDLSTHWSVIRLLSERKKSVCRELIQKSSRKEGENDR